jgi:Flp pilus assembly protein TadG
MSTLSSHRAGRRGRRRGAAALELGLILPLLVTIVLGCVDFGRFAYTYIAVTNGARAGAGYASVVPFSGQKTDNQGDPTEEFVVWLAEVEAYAKGEMVGMDALAQPNATGAGFEAAQIEVSSDIDRSDPVAGRVWLEVTVGYPFQTLVSWPTIPNSMTLTRTSILRAIR